MANVAKLDLYQVACPLAAKLISFHLNSQKKKKLVINRHISFGYIGREAMQMELRAKHAAGVV